MRFHVRHTTQYTYSRPVFIEPHRVRLHPRCDAAQTLERYEFNITPKPAGWAESLDAENNTVIQLWFEGLHDHFKIDIDAEVTTLQTNPFRGLITDGMDRLPLTGLDQDPILRAYLKPEHTQDTDEKTGNLIKTILEQGQYRILDFLGCLNETLYQSIEKVARRESGIQMPHHTLSSKKGACRDLAAVFMVAASLVGIPARFVSGYQLGDPDEPYNDLHAWAEVFIPGLGWRGYDPTHGLVVADRHIVVAASYTPAGAAPLTGTFRGTGAISTLKHTIQIDAC